MPALFFFLFLFLSCLFSFCPSQYFALYVLLVFLCHLFYLFRSPLLICTYIQYLFRKLRPRHVVLMHVIAANLIKSGRCRSNRITRFRLSRFFCTRSSNLFLFLCNSWSLTMLLVVTDFKLPSKTIKYSQEKLDITIL